MPAVDSVVESSSATTSAMGSVVDYLQQVGQKYQEHIALLRDERRLQEMHGTTFRPVVSAHAEASHRRSILRNTQAISERLYSLHQKKLQRDAQRHEEERQAQAEAEQSVCTHHPTVTVRAASLVRDGNIPEITARWLAERDARRAQLHESVLREELRHVRATPQITSYAHEKAVADRRADIPVEDLLMIQGDLRRRRQYALAEEHLANITRSTSASICLTNHAKDSRASPSLDASRTTSINGWRAPSFTPVISDYASRLVLPTEDVVDRLYGQHKTNHTDTDEGCENRCTFRPKVCEASEALSRVYYCNPQQAAKSVYDRLYENPHMSSKYRKPSEEEYTYNPRISDHSRRLASGHRSRAGSVPAPRRRSTSESEADTMERPLSAAVDKRRARSSSVNGGESPCSRLHRSSIHDTSKLLADAASSPLPPSAEELTFHPRISAHSEALWQRHVKMLRRGGHARGSQDIRQLLWRQAQKRKAEAVQRAQAVQLAEAMRECTFQPKAGRAPRGKGGYDHLDVPGRSAVWAAQRDKRVEALRDAYHRQAEEEHTFAPAVHSAFPLPKARVALSAGEENFLSRQTEARRRRDEAAEWWKPSTAKITERSSSAANRRGPTTVRRHPCEWEECSPSHFVPQYEPSRSDHSTSAKDSRLYATSHFGLPEAEEGVVGHHQAVPPISVLDVHRMPPYRAVPQRY